MLSASSRAQSEVDEGLRAQLALLPVVTPSEQAYAALAAQLLHSMDSWRAKADQERRRAEQANLSAQHAISKLTALVAAEGDTLLTSLRAGASIPACAATTLHHAHASMLAGHAGSASAHSAHPSQLSRRVSFNRDVLMVLSPEIGHGGSDAAGGVGRVDEEEDGASTAGRAAKASSSATGAAAAPHQRRLSRTEIGEGAPLKAQHLPIEEIEKATI